MGTIPPSSKQRTWEQVLEHYEIEKEMAERLRNSGPDERVGLYSAVYDEFNRRVPHHPMLTAKESSGDRLKSVQSEMRLLGRFLHKDKIFLEIGAGDCMLSFEAALHSKRVYAIEVSTEISKNPQHPTNFELVITDGIGIPMPPDSVDIAYSSQVMEHLHPDDAFSQLRNIWSALAPGGVYICSTPTRLSGPHDISKYFDDIATGFHLKEYTATELSRLCKKVGFGRIFCVAGARGYFIIIPLFLVCWLEAVLEMWPVTLRRIVAKAWFVRVLLGVRLVAVK